MKRIFFLMVALVLGLSVAANATLINRGTDTLGNRLIYDDDLDITWYDYTKSSDTWQNQMNWASNLSVTFGSQTFADWRLPSTVDGAYVWGYNGTTTAGYNITSSEMGHLYYTELGNLAPYDTSVNIQTGWGLQNTGDFQHLLASNYWSGTENPPSSGMWYFNSRVGSQGVNTGDAGWYALAVRPGDVAAAPVPEPGTWMLLGSGLAGLVVFRRRFARQ